MKHAILFSLLIFILNFQLNAQVDADYIKKNAIKISDAEALNPEIYSLLSSYQLIMFGEMHGTNESANFTAGLASLFTSKGDSIVVGLEIPSASMGLFLNEHTDSSVLNSDFYLHPSFMSGRESTAWAKLIILLNKNPRVTIFFFDVNPGEETTGSRDSMMAVKIIDVCHQYKNRKIITLGGNYHNRKVHEPVMANYILKSRLKINTCSLNMEYKEGHAFANFGNGIEKKALSSFPSAINSTDGFNHYFLLLPEHSGYPYDGFYFVKQITASAPANQH